MEKSLVKQRLELALAKRFEEQRAVDELELLTGGSAA